MSTAQCGPREACAAYKVLLDSGATTSLIDTALAEQKKKKKVYCPEGGTNPDPGEHNGYSNGCVDLQLQGAIGDFPV